MNRDMYYVSYGYFMAAFDKATCTLELSDERSGARATISLVGLYDGDVCRLAYCDFPAVKVIHTLERSHHDMLITFASEDDGAPTPELLISVDARGITLVSRETDHYTFTACGHLYYGGEDAYAISCADTPTDVIRCAIGPVALRRDNAIYDRQTDSALAIEGCRGLELKYDFKESGYGFTLRTKTEGVAEHIRFSVKKDLLADKYAIEYFPMKRRRGFDTPPAGFMTWYSLKFDTCESRVLENARFMSERLAPYGASTVWIDWEWCHRRYERERFDGVDNFHPDKEKYPHGLGFIADEIKRLGLVPAVWIGFTNDACMTDYEREHPEISLSHHDTWSGRYYYDMSHPNYINGYLTDALQQVKDWGFEAVKYDTLPNAITAHELYHGNMLHPERTTYSVYRDMLKRTREILGEDCYILSCGSAEEVILWGIGYFDAARIGPDLFTWEKYVETLGRIRTYYALHNNALLCDPDCVVLREEYSTYEQAKSRIIPVSLLGLPLNFGDDLTALPEDRIELLRRALPTHDVHPTDFNTPVCDGKTQLIELNIAREYECYTVIALVNLTNEVRARDVSFADTLRLPRGEYLVYDCFDESLLGIFDDLMQLSVKPYDTRLLAIRRLTGAPQLLGTSRHFTQGAAEICGVSWDEDALTLTVTADLIRGEEYRIAVYVPEGYIAEGCTAGDAKQTGRLLTVQTSPSCSEKVTFIIKFTKA